MKNCLVGLCLCVGLLLLTGCNTNLQAEQERLRQEAAAQQARAEELQREAEEQSRKAKALAEDAETQKLKAEKFANDLQKQLDELRQRLNDTQQKLEETQLLLRAREAHTEISKVVKSEKELDVVFARPVEGDDKVKEQQTKMDKVDHIKIDNVQVAYEQDMKVTLNAKTYKRHFRVMYIKDNKAYAFGYYTMEEIDGAAFAALLRKMFPIVDEQMTKYNVEVKRGKP